MASDRKGESTTVGANREEGWLQEEVATAEDFLEKVQGGSKMEHRVSSSRSRSISGDRTEAEFAQLVTEFEEQEKQAHNLRLNINSTMTEL